MGEKNKENGGAIQMVQHPRVFFITEELKNVVARV